MGGGNWSNEYYETRQKTRAAKGVDAFAHDRQMRNVEVSERRCHPSLDPKKKPFRESRDSEDHPNSLAIAVFFDETASMAKIPRVVQKHLDELMTELVRQGVVDAHVLCGAIGDATNYEIAPIQVGEWEADIRVDDHLSNIYLEAGGGGTGHESYELILYFMARHTEIDCYEKRGKKGFLFIVGDELPYERIRADLVEEFIGVDIESDIPIDVIAEELKERYHVFFLIPTGLNAYGRSHYNSVVSRFGKLFGPEHVLKLRDATQISKTIAEVVSNMESNVPVIEPRITNPQARKPARRSRVTRL